MSGIPYSPGFIWKVTEFTVTDGDTVRAFLSHESLEQIEEVSGLLVEHVHRRRTNPKVYPRGVPLRLINLDTPERGQLGWAEARAELSLWMAQRHDRLVVETWESAGGFDRWLADVFTEGRTEPSASEWMLRYGNNGAGWDPYVAPRHRAAPRDLSE